MEVPASLSIGTQVSAKYKGAFCEAKVKSVVKQVKCRVTFVSGLGSATLSDEFIRFDSNLSVGSVVEARHPEKQEYVQATVNKIQDKSQYTVVFDDGDITTLRRNALCMKSGKHYNASESLDNLPLTHPEHFSTPVSGSRRRKRGGGGASGLKENEENEESSSSDNEEGVSSCYLTNIGRVVWTENTENKKSKVKETWFPALIVAPSASDTVKINTKEEFLIRSFKDGRYYTVRKKDTNQFKKDSPKKSENPLMKEAMDKAICYMETKELPPHWDKEHLFNMGGAEESSTESSESEEIEDDEDEESREEKDHLVAELYKHMEDRGAPINRTPNIVGKDLDLYKLFRIVYKYGGHQRVTNNNKWRQIAHKLGFETTWCVNQVRVNYKRYLQSFEELYKTLGCTMKSGSSSKQRQGSGNGSSGRVQIRGRSREMLKQQLSSSKDSNSSHNEDTASSDSSKDTPINVPTSENSTVEKAIVSAKKPSLDESSKEDSEEATDEGVKPPVSASKKTAKDKKMTVSSASKSDSSNRKSKEETKPVGTRNRRDSNSSSLSVSAQVKTQKDEQTTAPSAKKSLTKELSEIDISKKSTKSSSSTASSKSDPSDESVKVVSKGRKKHKENKKAVNTTQSTSVTSSGNASSSGNNPSSIVNSSEDTSADNKSRRSSDSAGEEEPQYLSPDVDVRVGDKIKVFYIRGIIYDAKVIKCQEQQEKNNSKWPRYYVHYQGWNARYDEWINRSRIAENLSWTKDRPKKDGKDDSSDGSVDKAIKKEKTTKVDGRKERKMFVKRGESTSRAGTPGKSHSDSPAPSGGKRGTRGGVKKMESSDISDQEEEDNNGSKKCPTPVRVTNKKAATPTSSTKRGRGRKRKEESENEEIDIEKDASEETVDVTSSSPTKAKRGRKSTKESQPPSSAPLTPSTASLAKKEEIEEGTSKKSQNHATPTREQRPNIRSTATSKAKDSDKKSSIKKEKVDEESVDKVSKTSDEEDPYAFKEPEPFEEVKFETPPRKVSTPPSVNTATSNTFAVAKKNLDNELSPSKTRAKDVVKNEPDEELSTTSETADPEVCSSSITEPSTTEKSKPVVGGSSALSSLPKLEEEEDDDDVDDSDDEGKLEIVTPKKDTGEESPTKSSSITSDDPIVQPLESIRESIDEQPSVIIEIKKSPEKPTDDPGKPVLQLTEKQKELFPFLSAIRTASLGSISTSSSAEGGSKDEPHQEKIKIEVLTSPSKKPAPVVSTVSSVGSSGGSSSSVKKRKSHKRFNSSELVIESESESDEDVNAKPKEQLTAPSKDSETPASNSSTKNIIATKKVIKKDHDTDDVDLACAETIPGSPVHPGISDSNFTEEDEEPSSKSEKMMTKVVEVKKLEMPFATVPESGLGPAVAEVSEPAVPPPTPSLSIATKKIPAKTEKKDLETVLVSSSSSTKLPSEIAQPTALIVNKDINNDLPTSFKNEPSSDPPTPAPPPPTVVSTGYKSPAGDSTSDIDSNSGKIKLEAEESRLDVEGGSSSGDTSTNQSTVQSSSLSRRSVGLNKRRAIDKVISDAPRSPAQKRKRRTRDASNVSSSAMSSSLSSRYRGSTRGRHGSGRGVGIRGNLLDEETDESEETKDSTLNSLGSLDDKDLIALSQRSPKSSRYNFYVDLDPSMDSSERISLIQQNLEELRKTYLNIKSELALIERRRKKIRRKERERGPNSINSSSSGSNSGASKGNPAHIEVTA